MPCDANGFHVVFNQFDNVTMVEVCGMMCELTRNVGEALKSGHSLIQMLAHATTRRNATRAAGAGLNPRCGKSPSPWTRRVNLHQASHPSPPSD